MQILILNSISQVRKSYIFVLQILTALEFLSKRDELNKVCIGIIAWEIKQDNSHKIIGYNSQPREYNMFYIQTSLRRRNERFSERLLRGELIELSRSLEKTGRLISRVGSRASSTNRRRLSLERILVDLNNRANLKLRFSHISSGVRSRRARLFNNPLSNLSRLATRLLDLEMRRRRTDDIILFAHFLTAAFTAYPINMLMSLSTPPIRRVIEARRPDEIVVCTRRYVDLLLLLLLTITTWGFHYRYGIDVCYDVENVFVVCWVSSDPFITWRWCARVDFVMVVCWDVFGGRRLCWGRCYSATTTTSLVTTICCRWTWHCCCRRRRMVQFSIDFFVSTL